MFEMSIDLPLQILQTAFFGLDGSFFQQVLKQPSWNKLSLNVALFLNTVYFSLIYNISYRTFDIPHNEMK